jgi:hypothetical protein
MDIQRLDQVRGCVVRVKATMGLSRIGKADRSMVVELISDGSKKMPVAMRSQALHSSRVFRATAVQ